MAGAELPIEHFMDAAAWERWLEQHPESTGVWLKIAKKGSGVASVSYSEALDVALCHGWIDGQKKGYDAQCFLQRFTPRRARSTWSKINVARIESLVAAGGGGGGAPPAPREVEAARADGRWDAAYDGAKSMEVPLELAKALAKNRKAKAFFDTLDKTNRYAVCWRVQTAVKPETRQARVEKLLAMLARGEKIHGA